MIQSFVMAGLKGWKMFLTDKNTWRITLAAFTGYEIYESIRYVRTFRAATNGRIQKEKELERLKKELAKNQKETEENIERTKETQKEVERALKEAEQRLNDIRNHDPMKEEIERQIKHANQVISNCKEG